LAEEFFSFKTNIPGSVDLKLLQLKTPLLFWFVAGCRRFGSRRFVAVDSNRGSSGSGRCRRCPYYVNKHVILFCFVIKPMLIYVIIIAVKINGGFCY